MKTMNNFLLVMIIITNAFMISCNSQTDKTSTSSAIVMNTDSKAVNEKLVPVINFTETEFDFGKVNEGDILKHSFSFTNTGNAPLVIVNAKGSCGCTVSDWPKEPILPGTTKEMLVTFNTNGKPNLQTKKVTITANTSIGKHTLQIKAMVIPKNKKSANGIALGK